MLVALAGRLVRRPETCTILQTHLAVGNVQISTEAVTVFDKSCLEEPYTVQDMPSAEWPI